MKYWILAFALFAILAGCKGGQASSRSRLTPDSEMIDGSSITIQGVAANSKAGAMAGKYFVDGLQNWPADIEGKLVEVTGRLKLVEHKAEDLRSPDGAYSQGMVGTQYLLQKPEWRVVGE